MLQKLQELYEYLKDRYEPLTEDDLSINPPDKWEKTEYICCDQKIIHFIDGHYNISCLYDAHPSLRFKTKEEVLSFYEGYNSARCANFLENDEMTAMSIGLLTSYTEILDLEKGSTEWKNAISPHQVKYNDADAG